MIGFPSNQFGAQDPGANDEIASFCQINYGVSFPMMGKVDVNGTEAHPLWKWLKAEAPGLLGTKTIKWNFTKFLVGQRRQGDQALSRRTTRRSRSAATSRPRSRA